MPKPPRSSIFLPLVFFCAGLGIGILATLFVIGRSYPLFIATKQSPLTTATDVFDNTTATLEMDWSAPKEVDFWETFKNTPMTKAAVSKAVDFPEGVEKEFFAAWERGVVRQGPYRGSTLYWMRLNYHGPDPILPHALVLLSPSKTELRVLTAQADFSDGGRPFFHAGFMMRAPNLTIADAELPLSKDITLAYGQRQKIYQGNDQEVFPTCDGTICVDNPKFFRGAPHQVATTEEGRPVFTTSDGSLWLINKLGVGHQYTIESVPVDGMLVDWSPTYKDATQNYSASFSCQGYATAVHPCLTVINSSELPWSETEMERAGTLRVPEEPIYVFQHPASDPRVLNLYNMFVTYNKNSQKISLKEFLKVNPVPLFYARDAVGRWIEYDLTYFGSQAQ